MLSEAYQWVAMLQLGSNCFSFIAIHESLLCSVMALLPLAFPQKSLEFSKKITRFKKIGLKCNNVQNFC